jgi:4-amino-4-deoxy-L-arabinose transferase-like glycosyltransferase
MFSVENSPGNPSAGKLCGFEGKAQTARAIALFAGITVIALCVRLLVLQQIRSDPHFSDDVGGDGVAYLNWAARIASGDWIGHDVFYASPLYPYLVAIHQRLFGTHLPALLAAQALVGAIGCGILALAGRKLFNESTGLVCGLMLALYPAAISYDLQVDKTVLDAPLIAGALWCLGIAMRRRGRVEWLACGALLGICSLTRENVLALFVPILLWLWWAFRPDGWRRRAILSGLLLLGATCVIVPVCLRNSLVGGEFHLSTAKFGPNFYYGNASIADGIYFPLRPGRGDLRYEQQDATELAEQAEGRRLTLAEVSSYWTRRTLREIGADPMRWVRLTLRKIAMLWCDPEIADANVHDRHIVYSPLLRELDALWGFGVIFPLALAGAVVAWRERRAAVVLLLSLAVTYAISIAAFILFGRYRLGIVPMLAPLAAAAIARLSPIVRARAWRCAVAAALAIVAGVAIVQLGNLAIPPRIRGSNPYNRALLFASAGKNDLAILHYRRAIRRNPMMEPAHVNLALLLIERGNFAEAERLARRAVELDPADPAAHTNLGIAVAQRGQPQAALNAFDRAIELAPANRPAQLGRAVAMLRLGNRQPAAAILRDLAATQPADDVAHRARRLLADPATTRP